MARTKQTARRSTGGKSRRMAAISPQFRDHVGNSYTVEGGIVHTLNPRPVVQKLSIHLYTLSECKPNLAEIAHGLMQSGCYEEIQWQKERCPRIDVYPSRMETIEDCIEHHRREKEFRRKAVETMKTRAEELVDTSSDDEPEDVQEKRYDSVREIRGYEPLPHIVPTWCRAAKDIFDYHPYQSQRYRSFILVVPKNCNNYDDISSKGIWFVRFDQDISPAMDTDLWDMEPDDDQAIDTQYGWVEVEKFPDGHLGPQVDIKRACVHRVTDPSGVTIDKHTGQSEPRWWSTEGCNANLGRMVALMMSQIGDCCYRSPVCNGCDDDRNSHDCEIELSEHYFDEDGRCAAYTIHRARRRQSKRLAKRRRLQEL